MFILKANPLLSQRFIELACRHLTDIDCKIQSISCILLSQLCTSATAADIQQILVHCTNNNDPRVRQVINK